MYGQEKEIEGIKEALDRLIDKKNYLIKKEVTAADSAKFNLQVEIGEITQEIETKRNELARFTPSVLRIDHSFVKSLEGEMSEAESKGFYLAHQENDLQFKGLVNDLGAKQIGEDDFFEKLQSSFQNSKKNVIGQLIGSGGIGKTTFLRQIAFGGCLILCAHFPYSIFI